MEQFFKNLTRLVDLKSIVTIIIATGLIYFTNRGILDGETFKNIAIMVFTYFFSRQKGGNESGNN